MNENKNRATFQSRLGFILVSAGCAIGLGNVWKFPYICGQNGGGAFLFLYLICLVLLGLPILICEFAIGRGSNRSLSQAFNRLEKPGSRYHCTKYTSIAGNYLLMMFYTMVTGWMLYYAFKYATGSLDASSTAATAEAFNDMQASPWLMLIFSAIVIILCIGVCALGLQNGIEKVTKFMMILLMALMVVLAVTLVSAINPSLDLGSLAESVKKLVIWLLGIVMTLFTGLLSIQSFAGAAADNLSARAVKFAASSFIPVIGGSVSEAYSAVKGSIGVIRTSVGVIGVIIMSVIVAKPLLTLLAVKLAVWIGAIINDIFGISNSGGLLKSINSVLSIGVSILAAYSIMFVISTSVVIKAAKLKSAK